MSVQFGRWKFDKELLAKDTLARISDALAPYAPDSSNVYSQNGVDIIYRAFHTTTESHHEKQPTTTVSGKVITWDGRLDNREDLSAVLQDRRLDETVADIQIVSAAYDTWGSGALSRLTGDWAISIWSPSEQSLILAKDPIGARHLYYSFTGDSFLWCTVLDSIVRLLDRQLRLSEEYIAGWFACFPAAHLTPYAGIHAVPPSSFVLVRPNEHRVRKYWDFDGSQTIHYTNDADYEEHFRAVFAMAVRRRLRSDRPILAELSGGMDSASIVCMADEIAVHEARTARVDTISYYDDSDPRLDERHYICEVEERRGRAGCHIDLGSKRRLERCDRDSNEFKVEVASESTSFIPELPSPLWSEVSGLYAEHLNKHRYRVVLSGIAGENSTGGYVPHPRTELHNLLLRAHFVRFFEHLNAWAEKMHVSRATLTWDLIRGLFTPLKFPWAPETLNPPSWFRKDFVRRNRAAFCWYPSPLRVFGPLPSFQEQIHLLNHARRYLASSALRPELLRETRYPYLDRDLLAFACAIPREQMVGVGKRRFLMKRSLTGIVPSEILDRKRRAVGVSQQKKRPAWAKLIGTRRELVTDTLGFVDSSLFWAALEHGDYSDDDRLGDLERTVFLELWLRRLTTQGVLATTISGKKTNSSLTTLKWEHS